MMRERESFALEAAELDKDLGEAEALLLWTVLENVYIKMSVK